MYAAPVHAPFFGRSALRQFYPARVAAIPNPLPRFRRTSSLGLAFSSALRPWNPAPPHTSLSRLPARSPLHTCIPLQITIARAIPLIHAIPSALSMAPFTAWFDGKVHAPHACIPPMPATNANATPRGMPIHLLPTVWPSPSSLPPRPSIDK